MKLKFNLPGESYQKFKGTTPSLRSTLNLLGRRPNRYWALITFQFKINFKFKINLQMMVKQ